MVWRGREGDHLVEWGWGLEWVTGLKVKPYFHSAYSLTELYFMA